MSKRSLTDEDKKKLQEKIDELPSIESILEDEKTHAGTESNLTGFSQTNIHIVLRGYVDDISFKVPRLLASSAVSILCILLQPTGARFSDEKRQQWDINADPQGGAILVGVPLWGPEVDFEYRVGSREFLEQYTPASVVQKHLEQLEALKRVIENAPDARDVGSAV